VLFWRKLFIAYKYWWQRYPHNQ